MGGPLVEVVARTIEVHGQQVDALEPILLAVGLQLNEQHLLRQSVWRVRLLRIAVPQIVLPERHRGVLGIGAHGAHADEALNPTQPTFLDQLDAHDRVVVEELPRRGHVKVHPSTLRTYSRDYRNLRPVVASGAHSAEV